jgi:hypothetical protein
VNPETPGTGPRRWKILKLAVLGFLVFSCVVFALMAVVNLVSLGQAQAMGRRLESRFGGQAGFVPRPDGRIEADRLRSFLVVRRELMVSCPFMRQMPANLGAILHRAGDPNRSVRERLAAAQQDWEITLDTGWQVGAFFKARDQTLWMRHMSLGEYSYIYVLAYARQLGSGSEHATLFGAPALAPHQREVMIRILDNQVAEARSLETKTGFSTELETELRALRNDPDRLPWQDGLPEPTRLSLEPFRSELDEVFCEASIALELRRHPELPRRPFGD